MKKNIREILIIFIVFAIFITGRWIRYQKEAQYMNKIATLLSLDTKDITLFRVYPKVGSPVGEPIALNNPPSIIDAFFTSLTDQRRAESSLIHDGVNSVNDNWFLEISTTKELFQINCYIPARRDNIVIGEFHRFDKGRRKAPYGSFQSQQLYDWYQTYSHRWITPENDRDSE